MTTSPLAARLGVREPRVCRFPDFGSSAGQEAVELAASAGLFLDPWQQDVLIRGLGERPDGTWAALEVGLIVARQCGKGAILEARELAGLFLFGEQLIMHTAHELKTSLEAFRRIERLVLGTDDLRRRVKRMSHTNGSESIELLSGARLKFIARSKASGRGLSGDTVILDEAYELSAEQMDALMPTLSARPNPQIWYTSSPPLDRSSGEQLFNVRRRALASGQRLAYFDFGADGHLSNLTDIDLDDRDLWAATNPAFGIRVSEEFIEQERQTLTDVGFARERLCIWPDDPGGGWAVIGRYEWDAAADAAVAPVLPVSFGLEVEWDRSKAAIAVAWRRDDGLRQVELTADDTGVDYRSGTGWVVERVRQLMDRWQPCSLVLDPGGPAGSLVKDLEDAGIRFERMSTADAGRAYGWLYDGVAGSDLAARDVRHGNQPALNAAVAGAVERRLGDARTWDRKASRGFCPLGAATAALWMLPPDYDVMSSVF